MQTEGTVTEILSERVSTYVSRGCGLGSCFNQLRALQVTQYLSDYALMRFILYEMDKLGVLPSPKKIGHHFRTKISKEDWEGCNKREILRSLYFPTLNSSTGERIPSSRGVQKKKLVSVSHSFEFVPYNTQKAN